MRRLIALSALTLVSFLTVESFAQDDAVRVAFIRAKEDERGVFHGTLFVKTIGGTERQITTNAVNAMGPVWSPDGTKIAFSDFNIGINGGVFTIIYIADLVTGKVVSTGLRGAVGGMTNELMTFGFDKGMKTWVGVARLDGSDRVDLASDAAYSSLSSDGLRVLFRGLDGIDIINRDGTGRRAVIRDPLLDVGTQPRFTANDEYVVYVAHRGIRGGEHPYVFVRHIETGEETNLGQGGLWDVVGDWIVFDNGRQFAVSLDGKTRFELPWKNLGIPWNTTGWAHGDLATLALRAVSSLGKLPTTWAAMKTR